MTKVLIAAAVTLFLSIVCAVIHIKFSALPVDPQDYDSIPPFAKEDTP